MKTVYQSTVALTAALLAPLAGAHVGHGFTSAGSLLHYLVEPIHLVPIVLIVAVAYGIRRVSRRKAGS